MHRIACFAAILLAGCSQGGATFEGGRVHEVTPYHHQIVVGNTIALEGYVYDVKQVGHHIYVAVSVGQPFVCGDGVRFVLDREPTVLVVDKKQSKQIKWADRAKISGQETYFLEAERSRDSLLQRLPMLFDSNGCHLQPN